MAKRYFLFSCIQFWTLLTHGGDWAQWHHKTPGGNMISYLNSNDKHSNFFICSDADFEVPSLQKWYFYKGYIIGSFEDEPRVKYFIINEADCSIELFTNIARFENIITTNHLNPLIWKRWHNDNWGFFFEGDGAGGAMDWLFLRGTWLVLPVVSIIAFQLIRNKFKNILIRIFAIGIVVVTFVQILLDLYPMSF